MQHVNTLLGLVELGAYRLRRQPALTLCRLAGLAAAVALLASIPLYAEAVHNRLLQGQLTAEGTVLPPFSFVWRYVGSWQEDVSLAAYDEADAYLGGPAASTIGLPLETAVRHVQTTQMQLFPDPGTAGFHDNRPLLWTAAGFLEGLEQQAYLLEGAWPGPPTVAGTPVVASRALAERLGLQVGERYLLFGDGREIPLLIAGVWQPLDPADPFWFYRPDAFDDLLLAGEEGFRRGIAPALAAPVSLAVWYQRLDGSRVRTDDVDALLIRVRAAEARASALLPGVTLPDSPVERLQRYRRDARQLTLLLTLFSLPLLGLLLYFILLIAGMSVQRGQQAIALLRSRGSSRRQILLLYLVEGLLLAAGGLAGGLLLGPLVAGLMGRTLSFLQVDPAAPPLPIVFTATAGRYALAGVALSLAALLLPALSASRQTIVQVRQAGGRHGRPLWQRFYLDLLLLPLPLGYGWYLLSRQGAVTRAGAAFSDPLLFLVPALFCVQLALLLVRVLPLLARLLAGLAGRAPGVTLLLTLRTLARRPRAYAGPLLLLCLTLSLAVFTASAAHTLDDHLVAQTYYRVGADVSLAELGALDAGEGSSPPAGALATGGPATAPEGGLGAYRFLPVAEHLRLEGVQAVARVGGYNALARVGGQQLAGRLLGIDRLAFPAVAYFRPDFAAGESLGSLMNRLGAGWNHLLVSRPFLQQNGLAVGDPLPLVLTVDGEPVTVPFLVAGAFSLFPTHDPATGPLFVANLDYVHERIGGLYHYDVWLDVAGSVPGAELATQAQALGFGVLLGGDAREEILAEQSRPARQGLFGLLSAGFLTAGLLAVLGYLVYAVAGFRARQVEAGLLRALGVGRRQLAGSLAGEQLALIGAGVAGGLVIGVAAGRLFLPYLQVGPALPAFAVQIDWQNTALLGSLLGSLLLLAMALLLLLLLRMKLFVAVKLGETV